MNVVTSKSSILRQETQVCERQGKAIKFIDIVFQISELGGVPMLVRSADMVSTIPDQKVTSTFLVFLAARLMDLSADMKAARRIQLAWRTYRARRRAAELKVKYGLS
jgi:hypothetical protein